jgi:hypothetical protein
LLFLSPELKKDPDELECTLAKLFERSIDEGAVDEVNGKPEFG